jgi:hypothetical protein
MEDDDNKKDGMMEELMPELVEMVLSQVDRVSLVACRFVCTSWMCITTISPPPRRDAQRRQEQEDWSRRFAVNGWLALLQWARANGAPWGEETCSGAAKGGHLEVLQGRAPTAVPGTTGRVRLQP